MQQPLVSIITLNYNQLAVTCEFLESTRHLTYGNYEILVCDMASDVDPTDVILAGSYVNTRVLVSKQNLGFAGGNNWGMSYAKGDFILIINNDTELPSNLLELLLEPFYKDEKIGVVSPKIKFYFLPNVIQYAGFNPMNPFTGRTSEIGNKEEDLGQYDQSGFTNCAHGCAMMVKREVAEKVGKFPEKFFLYYEEWDWSARILKAEYKIWYNAQAVVYHKESMSVGKQNPMKVYYHTRNRILYMRRNASKLHLLSFFAFFLFFSIPKSLVTYIRNRQFSHLKFFIKGIIWNLYSSSYSPI